MVTGEGVEAEGVNEIEHAPAARLHLEETGENDPGPVLNHMTVPVGVVVMLLSVAVQVVDEPTATDAG